MTHSEKKQEITCNLKLSPLFPHVPDCANRLFNVGKFKFPHKCLYKVIKAVPVVMVPRWDKCLNAYVTESKSCFIFSNLFFFCQCYFFDLASGRVCAAVNK